MQEDLMIQKIVNLEADVAVIKEKIGKIDLIDDVLSGQDKMITILSRLDQERIFNTERIKRL
jgi:hypothetical protein